MPDPYKYEVIIYWSDEDEAFIAEVPELPGCAADGATYAEVMANVEVIISEWIETAQAVVWPNEVDFCPDVLYSLVTGQAIPELEVTMA